MLALVLLAVIPVVMWCTQSVLLARAGLPIRGRISAADLPRSLKRINRAATYLAFVVVLVAYPLLRGHNPLVYYRQFLPGGDRPWEMLYGASAAILYLVLLYLAWMLTGNVRFELRHGIRRIARSLGGAPLTALLAAGAEELLFRAMLLAGLLETFNTGSALAIGVIVFAGAHYVRSVKRYWTFAGHLALGTLFCVAFVCTHAIWLSMGLHAGGVLILMAVRPFVRYTGPAWLVGASIFPYAGLAGLAGLILLTINVWLGYGVTTP